MTIALDDWEETKRTVAKLERLHSQKEGQFKEVLRQLRKFGIKSLKEGIVAKRDGLKLEIAASEKWAKAMRLFEPELEKIKDLLEEME